MHCSPGEMPVPPTPRAPIDVDLSPAGEENRSIPRATAVLVDAASKSPLSVLGGDLCFSSGVRVDLPPNTEEIIWAIPENDLIQGGIEMICRGLVLTRMGAVVQGHWVEEISRLEHELSEGSSNLRQAVDANTTYERKLAEQPAERELDAARIAELEWLELARAAKINQLKRALEEVDHKMSNMEDDMSALKKEKDAVNTKLDKTIDETMTSNNQRFSLAIRQAHVL